MPEPSFFMRRASIVAVLTFLVALVASAAILTDPGYAGKPAKCSRAQAKKKKSACAKASRPRYRIVRRSFVVAVPHTSAQEGLSEVVTVDCPRGEQVLGGGAEIWEPFLSVTLSAPDETTTGWSAQIANLSTSTDALARLGVFAVCEIEAHGRT